MHSHPQPALASDNHDAMLARCAMHSRSEILHLLRTIQRRNVLVNLDLPDSRQIIVTALIGIQENDNALYLDIAQGDALNHELLAGKNAEFVTQLEGVTITFATGKVSLGEHAALPALRIPIPETLIRLQRREHFRVPLPGDQPVKCIVPTLDDDPEPIITHLLDIGVGGVALADRSGRIGVETARTLPDCRLLLPERNLITISLEVRNSAQVRQPNGAFQTRLGCKFIDLPHDSATLLRRFVLNTERVRNSQI